MKPMESLSHKESGILIKGDWCGWCRHRALGRTCLVEKAGEIWTFLVGDPYELARAIPRTVEVELVQASQTE